MERTQLTQQQFDKLKAQLNELSTTERTKVLTELAEARAQGDLSENADYDAARRKQAELETKIANLTKVLENVEIVEVAADGSVCAGTIITVKFLDTDEVETYEVVNFIRSNAEPVETLTDVDSTPAKISTGSPLVKALMSAEPDQNIVDVIYSTKSRLGTVNHFYQVELLNVEAVQA